MKRFKYLGCIMMMLVLCACGGNASTEPIQNTSAPAWDTLKQTGNLSLSYAEQFTVDYYEDVYALITVAGQQKYLVVPEETPVPSGLDAEITVLQQPLDHAYLVSTAAMDYFRALDCIEMLSLSGTKEQDWYLEEAKQAMADGKLLYAGKYSAPDYELIAATDCHLAIENTMIYHTPKVKESLEALGIPVFVDYSSYETHPLGRMEWLKLYGVLMGKTEQAEAQYAQLTDGLTTVLTEQPTGTSTAFFYITSSGAVSVRKGGDYVARAIELAGGSYVFSDLADDTATASMNMQMESFYSAAKDADILIYNSTIDGELTQLSQLLEKSSLLADFKAVQNKTVWCTEKNLFQESLGLADLIRDLHTIMTNPQTSDDALNYLHRLQ